MSSLPSSSYLAFALSTLAFSSDASRDVRACSPLLYVAVAMASSSWALRAEDPVEPGELAELGECVLMNNLAYREENRWLA